MSKRGSKRGLEGGKNAPNPKRRRLNRVSTRYPGFGEEKSEEEEYEEEGEAEYELRDANREAKKKLDELEERLRNYVRIEITKLRRDVATTGPLPKGKKKEDKKKEESAPKDKMVATGPGKHVGPKPKDKKKEEKKKDPRTKRK